MNLWLRDYLDKYGFWVGFVRVRVVCCEARVLELVVVTSNQPTPAAKNSRH